MSWKATAAVREYSSQKGSAFLLMILLADHHSEIGQMIFVSMKHLAAESRMTERNIRYLISRLVESGELYVYGVHRRTKVHVYGIKLPGMPPRETLANVLLGKDAEEFELVPERPSSVEGEKISYSVEIPFLPGAENSAGEQEKFSPAIGKDFPGNRKTFPPTLYIDQDPLENDQNDPPLPPQGEQRQGAVSGGVKPASARKGKKATVDPATIAALQGKGVYPGFGSPTEPDATGPGLDINRNGHSTAEKPQDATKGRSVATDTGVAGPGQPEPASGQPAANDSTAGTPAELRAWFDKEFWPTYPLKVGKKDCLSWVERKKPSRGLRIRIIDAIRARRMVDDAFDAGEMPPTPNPFTWLNGERWDDQIRDRNGRLHTPEEYRNWLETPAIPAATATIALEQDDPEPLPPTDLELLYAELGLRSDDQAGYLAFLSRHKLGESFRATMFYPPVEGDAAVIVFHSQSRCDHIKSRAGESVRRTMNNALVSYYGSKKPAAVYLSVVELRNMMRQEVPDAPV